MKVLMVTPLLPYPTAVSAGALVMHGQLETLLGSHDVTLLTFAGPNPAEKAAIAQMRSSGIELHYVWRSEPAGFERWQRRYRLARAWLQGRHPMRVLEFADPAMQRLLDQLLIERQFDLLEVEDNAMAVYHYPTDIPAILTEHDVRLAPSDDACTRITCSVERALRRADWYRWLRYSRMVWPRFDRIQVFTSRDATAIEYISPELAERVRVNPFGIGTLPEAKPECEEPNTVVFIGAFTHPPNVDAALWLAHEIMPRLRARRPGVRLIIVGSEPPEKVWTLARDDIAVIGSVPAVEPYLEHAAVVLAPLRTGGGMRLKVLQAMAYGKAVVTTSIGAAGLAVTGVELPLVIADDADDIANSAAELLAMDDTRHMLGCRARSFVTQYHSWLSYRQRLEVTFAELRGMRFAHSDAKRQTGST